MKRMTEHSSSKGCLLLASFSLWLANSLPAADAGTALPQVTVSHQRRAFSNGEHNAFTDLCRFHGQVYLTFRSCPEGHMVHPSAYILILSSGDEGQTWQEVNRFSVKDRDTRDPHFLVFKDRLFVYAGTWYSGPTTLSPKDYDMNKMLGFAVSTDDGKEWTQPVMLEGTFGFYIWRAATFGDKAYLCARRKPGFDIGPKGEGDKVQSLMLESDDGLVWKKRAYFTETAGDETAFLFEANGNVLAIGRHGGNGNAMLLRSGPPYAEWDRQPLDQPVGGPLVVSWAGHTLVGGRQTTKEKGPKMVLSWLTGTHLQPCAELPSGGDCSYPGFVELADHHHALVSWYSSHETNADGKPLTAVYLAEIGRE